MIQEGPVTIAEAREFVARVAGHKTWGWANSIGSVIFCEIGEFFGTSLIGIREAISRHGEMYLRIEMSYWYLWHDDTMLCSAMDEPGPVIEGNIAVLESRVIRAFTINDDLTLTIEFDGGYRLVTEHSDYIELEDEDDSLAEWEEWTFMRQSNHYLTLQSDMVLTYASE